MVTEMILKVFCLKEVIKVIVDYSVCSLMEASDRIDGIFCKARSGMKQNKNAYHKYAFVTLSGVTQLLPTQVLNQGYDNSCLFICIYSLIWRSHLMRISSLLSYKEMFLSFYLKPGVNFMLWHLCKFYVMTSVQ